VSVLRLLAPGPTLSKADALVRHDALPVDVNVGNWSNRNEQVGVSAQHTGAAAGGDQTGAGGLAHAAEMPPPEGKPVWVVIVAIGVIGLIVGVVWVSFASGARTFSGGYAFFPILMVVGVLAMLFGGRFGGGGNTQQMSRGKMDSLRARYMHARRAPRRWTAPLTGWTPTTAGINAAARWNRRWRPRMWERSPWARTSGSGGGVGVGMTR
jgi:hypothetical protein